MATFGEYTFVVTNMLTGKIIDEVELSSMHWDEIYNRPGGGRATARIHHPKTTQTNFSSWNNALWVLKDGDIRFGGFLGKVQPRAGTGVIEIPILGFMEYLRARIIRGNQGMAHATVNLNDTIWTQVEQFDIANDVVEHIMFLSRGDIGLSTIWDTPSGILRDETVSSWEQKFAGNWFEDFAARTNGFGWRQEYHYSGDDPKCRFRFVYPRIGRATDFVLQYDGSEGDNIMAYDLDGGQRPITGMLSVAGSGEGDDMVRTTIFPTSGDVRYDEVLTFKDVTQVATLTEKGMYHLQQRATPTRVIKIDIDWNRGPGYTEFNTGDEMEVRIDDGFTQVDSICTTISKKIVLSQEHDEKVEANMLEVALL